MSSLIQQQIMGFMVFLFSSPSLIPSFLKRARLFQRRLKEKQKDLVSSVLSSTEIIHYDLSSPCTGKTVAAEAVTVNWLDTPSVVYSYCKSSCLGSKEEFLVLLFVYYNAIYQICLISSFQNLSL